MSKEIMKAQIAELQRKLWLQQAQDIAAYTNAQHELHTIAKRDFNASGVIIQIQAMTGGLLLSPILISDGLGGSTLEQLSRDIHASHNQRIAMNTLKPVWQWKGA